MKRVAFAFPLDFPPLLLLTFSSSASHSEIAASRAKVFALKRKFEIERLRENYNAACLPADDDVNAIDCIHVNVGN